MHPNRKDAITHEQARKSLQRFVNLHFQNVGEKSRASIPAHQDDDDILLSDYISQQELGSRLGSGALREALLGVREKHGDGTQCWCMKIWQNQRGRHTPWCEAAQMAIDDSAALSLSSPIEPAPLTTEQVHNAFISQGYTLGSMERIKGVTKALNALLAPSRQGAAKRVEG